MTVKQNVLVVHLLCWALCFVHDIGTMGCCIVIELEN
jgi:hypothetical protein